MRINNNKPIDIYHDQDVLVIHSIWWNYTDASVFRFGKTTRSYMDYEHNL